MNTLKLDQVKALYFGPIIFVAILDKAADVEKTESQIRGKQKNRRRVTEKYTSRK